MDADTAAAVLAAAEGFAVYPRDDCPHVLQDEHVDPAPDWKLDLASVCGKCGTDAEPWYCLACSDVFCGRYVNKHALEHFHSSGHAVAIGFADLSAWYAPLSSSAVQHRCHLCESYIVNEAVLGSRLAEAHRQRFGAPPPGASSSHVPDPTDEQRSKSKGKGKRKGKEPMEISAPSAPYNPDKDPDMNPHEWLQRVKRPRSPKPRPASVLAMPADASRLPPHVLRDRIRGVLYGQAVGDAIGLSTEFLNRSDIRKYYGAAWASGKVAIEYAQIVPDMHRMRWKRGDWTDDTDQALTLLDSVLAHGGRFLDTDFAQRLAFWVGHGIPEHGDRVGAGLGNTVMRVTRRRDPPFLTQPVAAAETIWRESGCKLAANGGVMRTSVLGVLGFWDQDLVARNAAHACRVTHADPRCVVSAVTVAVAISRTLRGLDETPAATLAAALDEAWKHVTPEQRQQWDTEVRNYVPPSSLDALQLDEYGVIGYTLKSLGAGAHVFARASDAPPGKGARAPRFACFNRASVAQTLWQRQGDFRSAITQLVLQGGDADSNTCVAGAMLGARLGADAIPDSWRALQHRDYLEQRITALFDLMQVPRE